MCSFSDEEEESRFFDALDHIAPALELGSDCPSIKNWEYDVWIGSPQSVRERRRKFVRWMGLNPDRLGDNSVNVYHGEGGVFTEKINRLWEGTGAVDKASNFEDEFSSSRSSMSSWNTDGLVSSRVGSSENFAYEIRNSNSGIESSADDLGEVGRLRILQVGKSDRLLIHEEFKNISQLSPSAQQLVQGEMEFKGNNARVMNKLKGRWLSRLRSFTCMMSGNERGYDPQSHRSNQAQGTRVHRVKVRHCQRRLKELSALYTGQDIQAHDGAILAMKFSLDGQYLASAGEDKIVRVWQVVEDERSDNTDIPDADPSCIYFSVNHLSELASLTVEKDKTNKSTSLKKTPDSACIILPPKVFRILEKPLHVFQGHMGKILDISWSKNSCLLSSSVDKTVRLWRVGSDQCLKVFSHSDYVTCVQFYPTNDDYFISGSIDGKVRIWQNSSCQVVDWTEIKDIVTAVSYRPDGQGCVIGSISGSCYFFNISDNHFKLEEAQMCLTSKKKSPCKRITGFQFSPQDPSKVLVTCADSQVRILSGVNVIAKYKGLGSWGNQIYASFTSDGRHIVSASEDSNVYMWNYIGGEKYPASHPRSSRSFECFSTDASIAIPWSGLKIGKSENGLASSELQERSTDLLPFSSSNRFSLGQEFFLDSSSKGSATWPEEKLPMSSPHSVTSKLCKSRYKLFQTSCQSSSISHAWGLVIVTAEWDGRIRSFHNYGLPITV
ncbi:WD repeat-containing protein 44-like isoform X2 [Olea europaea var. sylvestris]|uniref:WD repeat-containing protein 44-like isoform X1 n=1 Tax=Olea europaea var. sylvestris TaxID=158386 RepID=UPI000C1D323F|nr:WD repeat-containing protein 44-like isoform X1 [Olea europaea var. sylvestris]XP_022844507.1 WD repeat-containing protein 44-like isoform X1 [Olea europaea var. sylvestris]XP_022844509.1 WD repeat-containing protein 44-like isoform X2 [Olea europaea var. sylvestris]